MTPALSKLSLPDFRVEKRGLTSSVQSDFMKRLIRRARSLLIDTIGLPQVQRIEQLLHLPEHLKTHTPPIGYYREFADWLTAEDGQRSGTKCLGSQSASEFRRQLPISLTPSVHSAFLQEEHRQGQSIFAYEIPNAQVWSGQGSIITTDNRIIVEISPEFCSQPEKFSIFQQSYLDPIINLPGTTVLLGAPAGYVYGHWMMDVLPRLGVLEQLGIQWKECNHFFVNGTHISFQKRSLELLGIPPAKWVSGCQFPHIRCEQLIAPSLPGLSGNIPGWAVQWLRKQFLPHAKDPGAGSRIYISRRSEGRNVSNEAELIEELGKQGFTPIILEKLSFEEQIGVFANAEIVIGGNGSGMFNLVFCSPQARVIELFGDAFLNVCQWAAGQHVPVTYGYVIGKAFEEKDKHPHYWNYQVQLADVLSLMQRLNT